MFVSLPALLLVVWLAGAVSGPADGIAPRGARKSRSFVRELTVLGPVSVKLKQDKLEKLEKLEIINLSAMRVSNGITPPYEIGTETGDNII